MYEKPGNISPLLQFPCTDAIVPGQFGKLVSSGELWLPDPLTMASDCMTLSPEQMKADTAVALGK